MATLETLLSPQMIERLGWTLVHFVWQAAAVAMLLAVVLRGLRRSSSNVRYVVACMAMALIVALPLVTMSLVEASRPVAEAGPTLDTAPMSVVPVEVIEVAELPIEPFDTPVPAMPTQVVRVPWTQRAANALEPALPWLVSGWLLGVFGLSAWHLGGWVQLQRMKRRLVSKVAAPVHARAAELAGRLGIRRAIGLWASPLIDVPAVVGWVKPVILLPVGVVAGLSVEQLEAIIAHELAHVRRWDYLVNLAQTVVEILGFYHPAVWWVSHRIRDERENCCDDLAVQVCGDSRRYARALTCLEELRHHSTELAVAASGGSLVGRIARLLGRPPIDNRRFAWLPGLIALLVVAALLIPTALLIAAPNPPTLPRPEANSTGQMGSRDIERTRFVHRNVEGRVDSEVGFERLIGEEGDHWIVAIPYSTQSVGKMHCHVRADWGELRFDGAMNQPTPDGGTFRGNVVIEITSSEPNRVDACTLYLDEVTFSAQNKRFTSSGPVRLVCGATELAGRGLELSFDEPPDRSDPSRLTVIAGVGVRIAPSGLLLVSLGEPKTESSEASASRQPVSVRTRPETADSRTLSLDERLSVMLDREPSADEADRQVLLSFTIAEVPSREILDRETAILVRTLLATEARENYTAPRLVQLRQPLRRVFREHLADPNLSGDTIKAVLDVLISNGYGQILSTPKLLTTNRRWARIILGDAPSRNASATSDRDQSLGLNLDVTPTIRDAQGIISLGLDITFPGAFLTLDEETRTQRDKSHRVELFRLSLYRIDIPNERYAFVSQASAAERLDAQGGFHLPVLLVKPTLIEPAANPTPALLASEQATPDAAREFVQTDPVVRELAKRIAEIEVELLEAQQTFLPEHPEIVQKKQLLEALRRRLEERRRELHQELDDDLATRLPSVRVSAKTPDDRASSLDEKPTVMLDIELVKFLTDQPLSLEAAAQLSSLWDQMYAKREAGREQRGSLPRAGELQISPRTLLERCTEDAQGDSEALEILVDLLASHQYLKVVMNPTVEVHAGQQAQVMSKQHVPNPTAQPGAPETVECRDLVTVTPRIDSAGHINLDLAAEICDVILNDGKTPRISKHRIDTKAVVDKDKTFVCRLESAAEGQTQDNAVLYLLARPRVVRSASSREPATVTATFVDADLIEALSEISEQTQAKIAVDPTVKPERITARLSGASVDMALQIVLQDTASTFKKLGDTNTYIVFRPLSGTFQGTDLREALRQVAEQAGVNITWDATVGGEAWADFEGVSLETALRMLLAGSPYVATRTPDGYAVTKRNVQPPTSPSREVDAVAVEARPLLVDPECIEALRRGLPIQGVTAPADVNALHEIGSGLAEGRTPVLEPNRVELLLKTVRQYAGSKMLAAPKVTVLDGESASMSLANHIHYVSGYREPNDPLQEPIPQHASKEIGVRLDTTPQIIEDHNDIRLQFDMEITSLLATQKARYQGKYEYDVPTFTTVTTTTEIVVPDGHTALIHVGPMRSLGDILSNESDPPAPMLMLIKPTRTPVRPPDPTAPMPDNRRPGDPGMGGLPPGIGLP